MLPHLSMACWQNIARGIHPAANRNMQFSIFICTSCINPGEYLLRNNLLSWKFFPWLAHRSFIVKSPVNCLPCWLFKGAQLAVSLSWLFRDISHITTVSENDNLGLCARFNSLCSWLSTIVCYHGVPPEYLLSGGSQTAYVAASLKEAPITVFLFKNCLPVNCIQNGCCLDAAFLPR